MPMLINHCLSQAEPHASLVEEANQRNNLPHAQVMHEKFGDDGGARDTLG